MALFVSGSSKKRQVGRSTSPLSDVSTNSTTSQPVLARPINNNNSHLASNPRPSAPSLPRTLLSKPLFLFLCPTEPARTHGDGFTQLKFVPLVANVNRSAGE
uniref:Uncharacterized protein n=1 Tax=Timema tahoe TaxID=61484 RepID=A0A7R9II01_9NEOP|nr:unnamed protein product [Timema tahoe]